MVWAQRCLHSLTEASYAACRWLVGARLLTAINLAAIAGCALAVWRLPWWYLFFASGVSVIPWLGNRTRSAVVLGFCPLVMWGYCLWRLPAPAADDLSRHIGATAVIFQAKVVEVINKSGKPGQADNFAGRNHVLQRQLVLEPWQMLYPQRGTLSGRVIATVYGSNRIRPGQLLQVQAYLKQLPERVYPWQFDYAEYLRRQGIFCLCRIKSMTPLSRQRTALDYFLDGFEEEVRGARQRLLQAHRRILGSENGDLLSSMVLGERAVRLPPETKQKFQAVGLAHVLAASGFNLSIVMVMSMWLGGHFIRNRRWLSGWCLAAMMVFVFMAGPSPSVVRAVIMISIILAAGCLSGKVHGLAALTVALLLTLLFDPPALADVGLQLSYLATAGIVGGADSLGRWLADDIKTPDCLAQPAAIIIMAQLSVLPLQIYYFWQIGLLFLPANLLVEPLVPVITILGFISSIFVLVDFSGGWLLPVAAFLDNIAVWPLRLMLSIVEQFASWETAQLYISPPGLWVLVVFYLSWLALMVGLRLSRYRLPALMLLACSIVILLRPAPSMPFTVAVVNHAVAVIDTQRRAFSYGNCRRFLGYLGAYKCRVANYFVAVTHDDLTIISHRQSKLSVMLIVDYRQAANYLQQRIAACAVVVLQGNARAIADSQVREAVVKLIRVSRARYVICDWRGAVKTNLRMSRQLQITLPGVQVLRTDAGCLVLQGIVNKQVVNLSRLSPP